MKNKFVSTIELIGKLHAEPKEVKNSTGGIKSYREIMSFVQLHGFYEDADKCESIQRTASQLAGMVELNFSKEDINEVKALYNIN